MTMTWETIAAHEWSLEAVDGNFYQYYSNQLLSVAAKLVLEYSEPEGESEWAEIVYAYYTDNTGAEWESC